jgi:hypothetical protein
VAAGPAQTTRWSAGSVHGTAGTALRTGWWSVRAAWWLLLWESTGWRATLGRARETAGWSARSWLIRDIAPRAAAVRVVPGRPLRLASALPVIMLVVHVKRPPRPACINTRFGGRTSFGAVSPVGHSAAVLLRGFSSPRFPRTYDCTRWFQLHVRQTSTTYTVNSSKRVAIFTSSSAVRAEPVACLSSSP